MSDLVLFCQTGDHHGRPATTVFLIDPEGRREPIHKCDECAAEMERHGWRGERIEQEGSHDER